LFLQRAIAGVLEGGTAVSAAGEEENTEQDGDEYGNGR
jgi:hypothetical protein